MQESLAVNMEEPLIENGAIWYQKNGSVKSVTKAAVIRPLKVLYGNGEELHLQILSP